MNPARVDLVVDIAYGVVIFAAVVFILQVGTAVGVAFGLGALISYIIHIGWKMGRFDPDWMTREVAEKVERTVSEEVETTVKDTMSEEVETTVKDTMSEEVEATVKDTMSEEVDSVAEKVEESIGEEVSDTIEETVNEEMAEAMADVDGDGRSDPES
jgi:hypothetical protein